MSGKAEQSGVSLLFASGERPDAETVRAALARCQTVVHISHEGPGLVELVVSGLAFDLTWLAAGEELHTPGPFDVFGFDECPSLTTLEIVALRPGPHLSGGLAMAPVVRAMLAVAAELAVCLPVRAVVWHPAATAMEPGYFSRTTLAWLAGGAFPALGLTALTRGADGCVASRGLTHFIGQEVLVEGSPGEPDADTLRMAARVVDRIAATGPVYEPTVLSLDGMVFQAEPARRGDRIWVWRQ